MIVDQIFLRCILRCIMNFLDQKNQFNHWNFPLKFTAIKLFAKLSNWVDQREALLELLYFYLWILLLSLNIRRRKYLDTSSSRLKDYIRRNWIHAFTILILAFRLILDMIAITRPSVSTWALWYIRRETWYRAFWPLKYITGISVFSYNRLCHRWWTYICPESPFVCALRNVRSTVFLFDFDCFISANIFTKNSISTFSTSPNKWFISLSRTDQIWTLGPLCPEKPSVIFWAHKIEKSQKSDTKNKNDPNLKHFQSFFRLLYHFFTSGSVLRIKQLTAIFKHKHMQRARFFNKIEGSNILLKPNS